MDYPCDACVKLKVKRWWIYIAPRRENLASNAAFTPAQQVACCAQHAT